MIIKTEDGYTFYILEDGRVSDSRNPGDEDQTWPTTQDFLVSQGMIVTVAEHMQANNQNTY